MSFKPYKLAYLVSHPIQYQAPLLRRIAASPEIDLTVFFLSDFSVRAYHDKGFGAAVQWDVPLLDGYKHVFLPAWGDTRRVTPLRPWTTGLRRALANGQFDALWMHGYAQQTHLRALLLARSLGIKTFLRTDTHSGCAEGIGIRRRLKEIVLRRLFALADGFLTVGSRNRAYFAGYGVPPSKLFSMPYAVDNDFFQSKSRAATTYRDDLRASLGLATQRPIILYVSRFEPRKRAGDLLEAYRQLSPDGEQEPHPYLIFVGEGEQRKTLEARTKEWKWSSVKFLGFKNQTELPAFYDLCDVFVLTSEREPWGLVVNEVMNAAKPVILSDEVGAAADLVSEGENGWIIPVGDTSTLADCLRRVTNDLTLAKKMGEASLRRIKEMNLDEDVRVLENALREIVGERSLLNTPRGVQ